MEMMTQAHVKSAVNESSELFDKFDKDAKGYPHAAIVYASCDILMQSINIASENNEEREAAVETVIGIIRNGV